MASVVHQRGERLAFCRVQAHHAHLLIAGPIGIFAQHNVAVGFALPPVHIDGAGAIAHTHARRRQSRKRRDGASRHQIAQVVAVRHRLADRDIHAHAIGYRGAVVRVGGAQQDMALWNARGSGDLGANLGRELLVKAKHIGGYHKHPCLAAFERERGDIELIVHALGRPTARVAVQVHADGRGDIGASHAG